MRRRRPESVVYPEVFADGQRRVDAGRLFRGPTYLAEARELAGLKRRRTPTARYEAGPALPPSELRKLTQELAPKVSRSDDEHDGTTLDFDSEAYWVVESIVGKRRCGTCGAWKAEYLVKWEGFEAEHNTWEPVDHLGGAIDALRRFEETAAATQTRAADARALAAANRAAAAESRAVAAEKRAAAAEKRAAAADARAVAAEKR
eukprot:1245061-Prymnesium_polylepis.1